MCTHCEEQKVQTHSGGVGRETQGNAEADVRWCWKAAHCKNPHDCVPFTAAGRCWRTWKPTDSDFSLNAYHRPWCHHGRGNYDNYNPKFLCSSFIVRSWREVKAATREWKSRCQGDPGSIRFVKRWSLGNEPLRFSTRSVSLPPSLLLCSLKVLRHMCHVFENSVHLVILA